VAAADGDVCGAKGSPGRGEREIEFFVANATKEFGLGGGTVSANRGKSAALAEKAAEPEDLLEIVKRVEVGKALPAIASACVHNKKLRRLEMEKAGHAWPALR